MICRGTVRGHLQEVPLVPTSHRAALLSTRGDGLLHAVPGCFTIWRGLNAGFFIAGMTGGGPEVYLDNLEATGAVSGIAVVGGTAGAMLLCCFGSSVPSCRHLLW
ncbi:hypothetical protein KCP70_15500 [Salmonella enterica subsp. enterica]|nr:hypothetical protein KCP70_15500 [Salmonella enterica subsp. enterica]